jgi:hypothetical protein
MNPIFAKIVTGVLIATLSLAGLPLNNAHAAAAADTPTPAAPSRERANARLERTFARQLRRLERIGKLYDGTDPMLSKAQKLIDKAKEKGLDVSALQAALEAFKAALPAGQPFYEQAQSIAGSHEGFDASGKVTDVEAARATVESLHDELEQFHQAMDGAGRSLHEALKDFREANPRPKHGPKSDG